MKNIVLNLLFLILLLALFFVPKGFSYVMDGGIYLIEIMIIVYLAMIFSIDLYKSVRKAIETHQNKRRSRVQKPKRHHRKPK
ncbi:MAG: hypothetical protein K9K93_05010 [Acholeplasmataceae bacterium]|nr:hypothetical protein [Acholeplasmataceae bacterium]